MENATKAIKLRQLGKTLSFSNLPVTSFNIEEIKLTKMTKNDKKDDQTLKSSGEITNQLSFG